MASSLTAAAWQWLFPSANGNHTSEQMNNYIIWRKAKQQLGLLLRFSIDAGKHQDVNLSGAVFPQRIQDFCRLKYKNVFYKPKQTLVTGFTAPIRVGGEREIPQYDVTHKEVSSCDKQLWNREDIKGGDLQQTPATQCYFSCKEWCLNCCFTPWIRKDL